MYRLGVTLLLAALRARLLAPGVSHDEDDEGQLPTPQELDDYFLRNTHGRGERRHKLRLPMIGRL